MSGRSFFSASAQSGATAVAVAPPVAEAPQPSVRRKRNLSPRPARPQFAELAEEPALHPASQGLRTGIR